MFRQFDFLGYSYSFIYEDDVRFKTNCGGIFSISLMMITFATSVFMGVEFFDRSSPNISPFQDKYMDPPRIYIKDWLNFSIRITDGRNNVFINSDKLFIETGIYSMVNNDFYSVKYSSVPMKQCDYSYFPGNELDFNYLNVSQSACPNFTSEFLTGGLVSRLYQFLEIRIAPCRNGTFPNLTCDTEANIIKYIETNNIRANLYFSDFNYDLTSYTDPKRNYINNFNIDISGVDFRVIDLFFQYSNLTSDDTYFFLTPKITNYQGVNYEKYAIRGRTRKPNTTFFSFWIKSSQFNIHYERSYTNLAQTISNVNGIMSSCMIVFNVMNFFISKNIFYRKLVEKSMFHSNRTTKEGKLQVQLNTSSVPFNRPTDKKLSTQHNDKASSNIADSEITLKKGDDFNTNLMNLNKATNLKQIDPHLVNHENLRPISSNSIDLKKKLKRPEVNLMKYRFDTSISSLFVSIFCTCCYYSCQETGKHALIRDYSLAHYSRYMDYFAFVDKFIELDLMKKFLFSKDEHEILSTIKKFIPVKNDEIYCLLKSEQVDSGHFKLRKKSSLEIAEEKLNSYLSKLYDKTTHTPFEKNLLFEYETLFAQK